MIGNIFKQQPGYSKDLQHAIQSIQDVSYRWKLSFSILSCLQVITNKIKIFHTQTGPKKLNTKSSGMEEIVDLLYYILDLSCTINRLFSVYPQGRMSFFNEDFHLTQVCW
jgi:hypothetical protein